MAEESPLKAPERFAIIGLGYVGLPVALAFAERFPGTIGFDINPLRVEELAQGVDRNREMERERLRDARLCLTSDSTRLSEATFFIVAVPTPIDTQRRPDLSPVIQATEMVARVLRPGALVVYESTVFPGVTEEICGPILERLSGLKRGRDFWVGYSPERINPGDRVHTFEGIVKVVAGEDQGALERVAWAYGQVVEAGVFRAASVKVAEAAKVIENTQRDLNIALMNELAILFDKVGVRTRDVLDAACTKWNFLSFHPGLVGGHCIGVDPYYLTSFAESLGHNPEVILAGRRLNESMASFVAQKLVKMLAAIGVVAQRAKVGVLGLTFKPNVADLRNSKVKDILDELRDFGVDPQVYDPLVSREDAVEALGASWALPESLIKLDALVLAVPHQALLLEGEEALVTRVEPGGVLIDVFSALSPERVEGAGRRYWSL